MIQGIYEVCMGVNDLLASIQYWEQFGYRIGQVGELPATAAAQLYGVHSSLRSVRLYHQAADHGLVRLLAWEQPTNSGLGLATMKARGSRWAVSLTADLLNLWNHVEIAAEQGLPLRYTQPIWSQIYQPAGNLQPFLEPLIGVREMLLLQPLSRQVVFERFHYSLPLYGQINPAALFQTSQFTHVGLVIQDDGLDCLRFYDQVLGLLRVRDDIVDTYDSARAAREIFDLQPGDCYYTTDFDDPRSSATDLQQMRSGRLKIIRFPAALDLPQQFELARPGSLGLCLYTYRVFSLEDYHQRVWQSQAQGTTEITLNEFGEPSFSFTAPDGYFWTLVEAPASV